jgi:hypothetical protein
MDVSVEVGDEFRRVARIFGPRVWYRRFAGLVPSPPEAFTSIPLTAQYAFGGKEPWDGAEIPSQNPDGMGFYLSEERAEGGPLPCIEDPAHLITKWNDLPFPVGFGFPAPFSGSRLRKMIRIGEGNKPSIDIPALHNAAFPEMIARRVDPGDSVRLSGVSLSGPLTFVLPRVLPVARIGFESDVTEKPMQIDQIGVEVERRRVFVSYRYPFRYVVRPLRRRIFEITLG